jgi:hypothetical protein
LGPVVAFEDRNKLPYSVIDEYLEEQEGVSASEDGLCPMIVEMQTRLVLHYIKKYWRDVKMVH